MKELSVYKLDYSDGKLILSYANLSEEDVQNLVELKEDKEPLFDSRKIDYFFAYFPSEVGRFKYREVPTFPIFKLPGTGELFMKQIEGYTVDSFNPGEDMLATKFIWEDEIEDYFNLNKQFDNFHDIIFIT